MRLMYPKLFAEGEVVVEHAGAPKNAAGSHRSRILSDESFTALVFEDPGRRIANAEYS
jgi:hypothetical protein